MRPETSILYAIESKRLFLIELVFTLMSSISFIRHLNLAFAPAANAAAAARRVSR